MKRICAILLLFAMVVCTASAETATSSLQEMYAEAELLMVQGDYANAATKFEALSAYSDAAQMTLYCKAVYIAEMGMYSMSVDALSSLGQFKDAPQLAKYYTACSFLDYAKTGKTDNLVDPELYSAILTEQQINKIKNPNYETTNTQLIYCYLAQEIFSELALYKDSLMKVAECKTTGVEILEAEAAAKEAAYQEALALEKAGNYELAIEAYKKLNDYMDSAERIAICEAALAEAAKVAAEVAREAAYQNALALESASDYDKAIELYKEFDDYKDTPERIRICTYQKATTLLAAERYFEAYGLFISLGEYKDSTERAFEIRSFLPAVSAQYTLYVDKEAWTTYSIDFEYDAGGNRVFQKNNNKSNPVETSYEYENGQLICSTESGVASLQDGDITETYTKQRTYNEQGDSIKEYVQYISVLRQEVIRDRTDVYSYTYEYENERISKKTCYLSDGKSYYDVICEYDDYGRLLRETTAYTANTYRSMQTEVVEYHYE